MEVGGDFGTLLRADPLAALLGEVAAEAQRNGARISASAVPATTRREDHVAGLTEGAVRVKEEQGRPQYQGDAEAPAI